MRHSNKTALGVLDKTTKTEQARRDEIDEIRAFLTPEQQEVVALAFERASGVGITFRKTQGTLRRGEG